jgi:iron complex outermembrane receptor protein
VRLAIAFQPFENFTGIISGQYDKIDDVGDVAAKRTLGQVTHFDTDSSQKFPLYQPYFTDMTDKRLHWEFNYGGLPAGMTITYLGGYDDVTWKHALDATVDPNVVQQQFIQEENPTTQNHELRLSGGADSPLFWQVGLFYFEEKNGPLDSGLINRTGPFAGRYLIHFLYDVKTESKAAFGQIAWNVTDAIKLSAGMRYTEDEKTRTGEANLDLQVASGGFLPPIIITTPGNGHIKDSKPTYHAGIDWQVTDDSLLYLKYDTGYKSGGFNSNGSAPSVPYGPETVDAIELGTKNRFAGDTVQLNAALFYQKYDGYQAAQSTPVISSGSGVQNAGDADIYGIEGEVIYAFADRGRFHVNASWLDTEFKEFNAITPDGTQNLDLAGNELPNAPDLSVSAGIEYGFDFIGGTLTPRIDGKYTSSFFYDFYNNVDTKTDATTVGNASLSFSPDSEKWNLQAYVRNFTDEVVFARMYRNYVVNVNEYQFAPPRTYGLRFQYNF